MRAADRVLMIVVAVASGCGRIGFTPSDDGAIDGPPTGPFGAAVPIAEVNTATAESDPAITGDQLELYFDSDRAGTSDVWRSSRASATDAWGPPAPVTELNTTTGFDGAVGITPDGLTIYVTSGRPGGAGSLDIWRSTRGIRSDVWSAPVFVPELSSPDDDSNPQPVAGELEIWLSSKRGGFASRQLYHASRSSTAVAWDAPVAVSELNVAPTVASEAPWISADNRELFFASNRPGTKGANDLWRATRAAPGDPFDAPAPVDELCSSAIDQDPWLSADLRVIVFMSRRAGSEDLYMATR